MKIFKPVGYSWHCADQVWEWMKGYFLPILALLLLSYQANASWFFSRTKPITEPTIELSADTAKTSTVGQPSSEESKDLENVEKLADFLSQIDVSDQPELTVDAKKDAEVKNQDATVETSSSTAVDTSDPSGNQDATVETSSSTAVDTSDPSGKKKIKKVIEYERSYLNPARYIYGATAVTEVEEVVEGNDKTVETTASAPSNEQAKVEDLSNETTATSQLSLQQTAVDENSDAPVETDEFSFLPPLESVSSEDSSMPDLVPVDDQIEPIPDQRLISNQESIRQLSDLFPNFNSEYWTEYVTTEMAVPNPRPRQPSPQRQAAAARGPNERELAKLRKQKAPLKVQHEGKKGVKPPKPVTKFSTGFNFQPPPYKRNTAQKKK